MKTLKQCVICDRVATTKYEDADSCGSVYCEMTMQEAIDSGRD